MCQTNGKPPTEEGVIHSSDHFVFNRKKNTRKIGNLYIHPTRVIIHIFLQKKTMNANTHPTPGRTDTGVHKHTHALDCLVRHMLELKKMCLFRSSPCVPGPALAFPLPRPTPYTHPASS